MTLTPSIINCGNFYKTKERKKPDKSIHWKHEFGDEKKDKFTWGRMYRRCMSPHFEEVHARPYSRVYPENEPNWKVDCELFVIVAKMNKVAKNKHMILYFKVWNSSLSFFSQKRTTRTKLSIHRQGKQKQKVRTARKDIYIYIISMVTLGPPQMYAKSHFFLPSIQM